MSNKELNNKINTLEAMKADIERRQAEYEALAAQVKAEMTKRNLDELDTGIVTVTYKLVKSTRLDNKALKAAHPKIYDRFLNTSETQRFTVKANKFATAAAPSLKVVSAA